MTDLFSLVGLYIKDLIRRKMVWLVVLLTLAVVVLNYWTLRSIQDVPRELTVEAATGRAAERLREIASVFRGWMVFAAVILGAIVAPESRRNGTSQFVLSLGIHR